MPLNEDKSREALAGKRLRAAIAPALLVTLSLFLFLPFTIYKGNIEEFALPLTTILSNLLLPSVALLASLLLVAVLLRGRGHRLWVSLIFALALLIWIEGNLIVWNYGDLDGINIDWSLYRARGPIDSIIWGGVIVLSLVFSKRAYRAAASVCTALIVLQLAFLGFQSVQAKEVWSKRFEEKGNLRRAPSVISEFSRKQNVIQIVLDAFPSDIFEEIVAEDRERYQEAFDDFTLFKGALAPFPTTYMSLPAMWSGKIYRNHMPMSEFYESALSGKTTASVLHDNGYEVDLVVPSIRFMKVKHTNGYPIHNPYGVAKRQYERANTAFVLDLTLFRALPHVLKKPVYNNQSWFLQNRLPHEEKQGKEARFTHFAHRNFLYDVIEEARVTRDVPLYKFIHLFVSHTPHVTDEDCGFAGESLPWNRANAKMLLRCSLDYAADLLEKLKELGIYDSSLIIVNADHGHGLTVDMANKERGRVTSLDIERIAGYANPLLAVKPPNAKGGFSVSNAEVSLTDIPDTIFSILEIDENFSGRSVFEVAEGERRTRLHNRYEWRDEYWEKDYMDNIISYTIDGDIYDGASWHEIDTHLSPNFSFWAKDDKIDFGTEESLRFLRFGWLQKQKVVDPVSKMTLMRALGPVSSLFLSLPKEAVELALVIGQDRNTRPVAMSLKVDGKYVGDRVLINNPGNLTSFSFKAPPNPDRPKTSIVEFEFSESFGGEKIYDDRLAFESLTIKEL